MSDDINNLDLINSDLDAGDISDKTLKKVTVFSIISNIILLFVFVTSIIYLYPYFIEYTPIYEEYKSLFSLSSAFLVSVVITQIFSSILESINKLYLIRLISN